MCSVLLSCISRAHSVFKQPLGQCPAVCKQLLQRASRKPWISWWRNCRRLQRNGIPTLFVMDVSWLTNFSGCFLIGTFLAMFQCNGYSPSIQQRVFGASSGDQDPLYGKRFKCTVCRDFDLCETCYSNRDRLHPGGHSFKVVPGHSAHTICPELPVEISVTCDGCGKKRIAPEDRFKCSECPDYDLCTACFEARSLLHPQHSNWQHMGQQLCCGSAPPAEPEPETRHDDGKECSVQIVFLMFHE